MDLLIIISHFTPQLQGLQQDCTALYLAQWISGSLLGAQYISPQHHTSVDIMDAEIHGLTVPIRWGALFFIIQFLHAKKYSMLHITLDAEIVLYVAAHSLLLLPYSCCSSGRRAMSSDWGHGSGG